MKKPKCPKCNNDATLVLDEKNFNILFELLINIEQRVSKLEKEKKDGRKKY